MVSASNLPESFWGEAVVTPTYLINRTPTPTLQINKIPYEPWHNKKPSVSHLRVFGSTVYVLDKNQKTKFDKKIIEMYSSWVLGKRI